MRPPLRPSVHGGAGARQATVRSDRGRVAHLDAAAPGVRPAAGIGRHRGGRLGEAGHRRAAGKRVHGGRAILEPGRPVLERPRRQPPTAARSCSPWPRAVGRGFGAPTSSDAASRPTPGNVPWGTAPGPPSRPRPAHPAPGSPLPHRADEAQRPVVTLRRLLGRGRGRRPARALARTRVGGRRAASRGPEPTCTDRPGTTSPPASTGRRSWCTARLKTRWPRS